MTDASTKPSAEDQVAKSPPPDLSGRAPRPHAVRLRKSVVQAIVLGAAALLAGALAWAFVIQPELRDGARARAAEARQDEARGVVRPSETVTDQPETYDRLPEPRIGADTPEDPATAAEPEPAGGGRRYAAVERAPLAAGRGGPSARELARRSGLFFPDGATRNAPAVAPVDDPGPAAQTERRRADVGSTYNGHGLVAPVSPYELKAGSMVAAVLLTAVDTSRAGPVVATVSQNLYDTVTGRHLLLPQGTRLIGRAGGDSAWGDRRAFLVWERLILPNGKSMVLGGEPGVDAQGAVGIQGRADRRIGPLLAATLFAGAITTLGEAARDGASDGSGGLLGDAGDAAAIEASRVGGRLVDRELEVRPSIRLGPGAAVRVMITRDLVLERYQP